MDAHEIAVPAIPGIDLTFRPHSYFGPIAAETHLLAHTTGHERREFLRAPPAAGGDDPMLDLIAGLFDLDRESLGQLHPALMGGEYLPPFRENETEIARISLASTTATRSACGRNDSLMALRTGSSTSTRTSVPTTSAYPIAPNYRSRSASWRR